MYTSIVVCALLAFYFLTQSFGLEIKIKTSIYAFCIFAAISVDLYEYQKDQNSEKLKIEIIKKRKEKKEKIDKKQDSILVVLNAHIEELLSKNDSTAVKLVINKILHTSDAKSPYKKPNYFGEEEYYTYKEYWEGRRNQIVEDLKKVSKKSLLQRIFD
jgi:hypothetical protein